MTNPRDKGKRAEREVADLLEEHGYTARRGRQFKGTPDSPDVICEELSALHIEVKRTERLRLYESVDQANEEAGTDALPVVVHRKNRRRWVAIMDLAVLLRILEGSRYDDRDD